MVCSVNKTAKEIDEITTTGLKCVIETIKDRSEPSSLRKICGRAKDLECLWSGGHVLEKSDMWLFWPGIVTMWGAE